MTTRMDGFRKRTRQKFSKNQSDKGKISIRKFLQKFAVGDKVNLTVEPGYQKGMYRPKFMGKVGTVSAIKGTCYEVEIKDINKKKKLIVHPIHLTKSK
ncbi:MAG: 50S ribosomal protein L21e [Candidatus Woesearchaeota archaeon]